MDNDRDLYEEEATPHFSGLLAICGPSSYLLIALLALIIAYPFYGGETLGRRLLFGVLTSAVLVSGAFAASQRRRTVVMALALAAPALALQWLYTLSGSPIVADLLCLTVAAFYAFTVANVLGYVLGPGPVTGDKLHAAVAAYILTALLWTALYALVDHLVPGSFSVNGISDLAAPLSWKESPVFQLHHADLHRLRRDRSHRWPCAVPGDPGAARRRLLRRDPDRPSRRTLSARRLAAIDVAHKWNRWCCPVRA